MRQSAEQLREQLLREKEHFDRDVLSQAQLSQAQRLSLWEAFLQTIKPVSERLVRAEKYEATMRKQFAIAQAGVYAN
jgi:hypothetical protein